MLAGPGAESNGIDGEIKLVEPACFPGQLRMLGHDSF